MFNRDRVFRLESTRQVHHHPSGGGHGTRGKGWKRQVEGGERRRGRYVIFPLISPLSRSLPPAKRPPHP